ncbi:hypothetical protein ACEPAH_7744 [Sanghuangporus vaninii]
MSTNSTIHESLVDVAPTVHIRLDDSLGAVLIGLIFASVLFGIANLQSLIYYQNSANDPKYMKWTVMFLWLIDAFHLALISHVTYRYLVTDFGSLIAVTRFYAYRVWIMSKRSRLLTFGALALDLVVFMSGVAYGIKTSVNSSSMLNSKTIRNHLFNSFTFTSVLEVTRLNWLSYISLGSIVASDLWCALCLCYYLARDRTGFKATDTTLNTLILYIVSTGLLTSLCSICCLILITDMPHSYSYTAVYFCLSKLYFNALLGMLNARNYLRGGITGRASDQEAYRLPQIVNIGKPSGSNHEASSSTVQVIPDNITSSVYKV